MNARRTVRALSLLAALALVTPAFGVELAPNKFYQAGTVVTASALGATMTVPRGWTAQSAPGQAGLVLSLGQNRDVMILVTFQPSTPTAEITEAFSQPFVIGELELAVTRAPQTRGNQVTASFASPGWLGEARAIIGQHGHAMMAVLIRASHERVDAQVLDSIIRSVRFTAPQQGNLLRQWQTTVKGMMLRKASSSANHTSERSAHFCSDGQYAFFSAFNASVSVPGGSEFPGMDLSSPSREEAFGRWRVVPTGAATAVVLLEMQDGSRTRLPIALQNNTVLVNGEPWVRSRSNRCS